jgi:excinuclease UvrABC ATPase subunit
MKGCRVQPKGATMKSAFENDYYDTNTYELNVYFVCDTCNNDNELTVEVFYSNTDVTVECETCKATYTHEIGDYDDYDPSCHCGDRCVC